MMMKGASLEAIVRHSADRLRDQGLYLLQTGPRFAGRVGSSGEAMGRLIAAGGLDFHGDLRGRAVLFDCKSTQSKTSFRLDLIKPHQAVIVKRAHERGAVAFFLVEFAAFGRYYALTWPVLSRYWAAYRYGTGNARASIPLEIIAGECQAIARRGKTLDLTACIGAIVREVTK